MKIIVFKVLSLSWSVVVLWRPLSFWLAEQKKFPFSLNMHRLRSSYLSPFLLVPPGWLSEQVSSSLLISPTFFCFHHLAPPPHASFSLSVLLSSFSPQQMFLSFKTTVLKVKPQVLQLLVSQLLISAVCESGISHTATCTHTHTASVRTFVCWTSPGIRLLVIWAKAGNLLSSQAPFFLLPHENHSRVHEDTHTHTLVVCWIFTGLKLGAWAKNGWNSFLCFTSTTAWLKIIGIGLTWLKSSGHIRTMGSCTRWPWNRKCLVILPPQCLRHFWESCSQMESNCSKTKLYIGSVIWTEIFVSCHLLRIFL